MLDKACKVTLELIHTLLTGRARQGFSPMLVCIAVRCELREGGKDHLQHIENREPAVVFGAMII